MAELNLGRVKGDPGPQGEQGLPGKDGSDATVTSSNITDALGYTPISPTQLSDKVKTDVPLNAEFTDTVTTINGKTGAIAKADIVALGVPAQDTVYTHPTTHPYSMITGTPTSLPASGGDASTVNGFTILKSVPANANFSDTTYSVISTAEIDAGVSTASRTISGAQVKHMLDKTKPVLSKVKPTNSSPIWYEEL